MFRQQVRRLRKSRFTKANTAKAKPIFFGCGRSDRPRPLRLQPVLEGATC